MDLPAVAWQLGTPQLPGSAAQARTLTELIRSKAPRMASRLIDDRCGTLDEQTIVPEPGPWTRRSRPHPPLNVVHEQRCALFLTSMPGVGVRTAAALLVTMGDGPGFRTAAHFASYAGLAPTTKSPGTSIHGNTRPEEATATSNADVPAFAALHDPASCAPTTTAASPARQDPHPSPPPTRLPVAATRSIQVEDGRVQDKVG